MQLMLRLSAIVAFLEGAGAVAIKHRSRETTDAIRYGPSSCILISQSSTGSCVITTDCEGVDTSQTEFGFTCVREGDDTQWHSYGNGGFEANEEFDSGMKCDECSGPSSDAVRSPPANVQMTHVEITAPTTSIAETEYIPVEMEVEAPTTTQVQKVRKQRKAEVEQSWEPSVWSDAPVASIAPPTAPMGIMPRGPEARSFLRARTTKKTVRTRNEGSDSDTSSHDDQSGAADTSDDDSKSGYVDVASEDFYDTAPIETDSSPQSSNDKKVSATTAELPPPRSAVQVPASEVETFGPGKCISTWRNSEGHCMLQTKCDNIDLSNVDVGMICVAVDGAETRHTFGKDSFDSDEVFDTKVECNKCTALRKDKTNKVLTEKLQLLSEGIKDLEKGLESINANVEKLNAKVFRKHSLAQTRKTPGRVYNDGEDSGAYAEQLQKQQEQEEEEEKEQELSPAMQAKHEEEERERVRAERKQRECEEGQEFNQGGDC